MHLSMSSVLRIIIIIIIGIMHVQRCKSYVTVNGEGAREKKN